MVHRAVHWDSKHSIDLGRFGLLLVSPSTGRNRDHFLQADFPLLIRMSGSGLLPVGRQSVRNLGHHFPEARLWPVTGICPVSGLEDERFESTC
jgi:hypothetical protein